MVKYILIIALLICCRLAVSQIEIKKNPEEPKIEKKGFYFGLGCELSSVNIFRNYRQNPYHPGFNGRVYYQNSGNVRVFGEYTYIPKFNVEPTWLNVTNNVAAVNVSVLATIKDESAIFYTITGICYQRWKGYYTGINDWNVGTKNSLQPNRVYASQYMGLNLGAGFEKAFSYDSVFGEFRYRFSKTDSGYGISDAAFTVGIKVKLNPPEERRKRLHGKYHWF
jgi:hypothetical protein